MPRTLQPANVATLALLRARVLDQLEFCREPYPDARDALMVAELRREELGVRFAVYRAFRKAAR